jgi:hypothetical protein
MESCFNYRRFFPPLQYILLPRLPPRRRQRVHSQAGMRSTLKRATRVHGVIELPRFISRPAQRPDDHQLVEKKPLVLQPLQQLITSETQVLRNIFENVVEGSDA